MYDGWTSEALKRKICDLKYDIGCLKDSIREKDIEIDHLRYRIQTELEPRLRQEARAYDSWVTDPERRSL